jgi:hypothetical protein
MKALFEPTNITFANKETVLELNGCPPKSYYTNHFAYSEIQNPVDSIS